MKRAIIKVISDSPISFSKFHGVDKLSNETPAEYERRNWREKTHYDEDENVFLPAINMQKCIQEASKFLGKIPGKGNTTYTKHFLSGIMVRDNIDLGCKKEDLKENRQLVPSDGKAGGTTRVFKSFPDINSWEGEFETLIFDENIDQKAFAKALQLAGLQIGVGRWRPRQGGMYGRFIVKDIQFKDIE